MRKPKNIPKTPGVYRMLDKEKNVLYVGKAKNLNQRISSYFRDKNQSVRVNKMISQINTVKWIEVASELEALILETNLIKELHPKYNIAMRDDKNFVYIKIKTNEDFPTIATVRKISKDGAKYFGPVTAVHKIEKTFKVLRKVLPFRTCSLDIKYENNKAVVAKKTIKYPCLDHYIKRCMSPCIGNCTKDEYGKIIEKLIRFLEGHPEDIKKMIKDDMIKAAQEKKFEMAASLRDKLSLIEEISQKQIVSDPNMAEMDIVNFYREGTYTYVNLFQIRNGKLINQENFTLKSPDVDEEQKEILESFIKQYYEKAASIPKEIIVPEEVDKIHEEWLQTHFMVPQKGDKKNLLDLCLKNAESYAKQSRIKIMQEGIDPLEELQKQINLEKRPNRIECYDISHISGSDMVGSMAVFENGIAKKNSYRKFKIRTVKKVDDYAALEEILKRRLNYLGEIKDEYIIKKALKKEYPFIIKIAKRAKDANYKQFYTIKKGNKICGFIREKIVNGQHILASLWVSKTERGGKLGHRLIHHVIQKSSAKRIYLSCKQELKSYYEEIGFEEIKKVPKGLEKEDEYCEKKYCSIGTKGIWFAYDKKKTKDSSFASKPDLIIIDGGKGQLSAAENTLKKFKLGIPVISIAKKQEEIFYKDKSFKPDRVSEALKLVQRVRDEAHRFAIQYHRNLRETF